jgi:hypothetical protein
MIYNNINNCLKLEEDVKNHVDKMKKMHLI